MKHESYDVKIENEDLFELKAWLLEMREDRELYSAENWTRGEDIRALERRLAIFEKIMRQLP